MHKRVRKLIVRLKMGRMLNLRYGFFMMIVTICRVRSERIKHICGEIDVRKRVQVVRTLYKMIKQ